MAASNNLVRRLHACETIGAATVICSDKTGTLTQNKMVVQNVHFSFLPQGAFKDKEVGYAEMLIAETISANTTAQLSRTEGQPSEPIGNPTEGSLLLWLEERGIDYQSVRNGFPIMRQWTFTTERKFMGTLGVSELTQKQVLYIKGAPEIVLARCSKILTSNGPKPIKEYEAKLHEKLKSYQSRGMRTLAFAYCEAEGESSETQLEEAAVGLYWLGFAAIADPVREDVPAAIQLCRETGIMVKIITGDTAETATEIARKIGLVDKGDAPDCFMTGSEFGVLDDVDAEAAAMRMKVLSRARPLDKLRVVKLLQKANQVVAVTGDGTNDAPALNHADVGPIPVRKYPALCAIPVDHQCGSAQYRISGSVHRHKTAADGYPDALGQPDHGYFRRAGSGDRTSPRKCAESTTPQTGNLYCHSPNGEADIFHSIRVFRLFCLVPAGHSKGRCGDRAGNFPVFYHLCDAAVLESV
ncbi:MAG: HAD family hydrolase [SAR324 cluster bacterium]|nr:HAD family hydrolase [SAR324 cluster bacterium]